MIDTHDMRDILVCLRANFDADNLSDDAPFNLQDPVVDAIIADLEDQFGPEIARQAREVAATVATWTSRQLAAVSPDR